MSPKEPFRLKICVSGSAVIREPNSKDKALELGREVARQGAVLLTGATTGYPYLAAVGAKEADGFVIGFSPGMSQKEHAKKYRLPLDHHDLIVYTGFGYAGRDLFLVRSADAVIHIAGRMGTLNEFTSAYEDGKIIGVLTGTGGTSSIIEEAVELSHVSSERIVYEDDPAELVAKVIRLIKKDLQ